MKIYKIAQNVQYLESIGVPSENIQPLLDYLATLEGADRRNSVGRVRKNPHISVEELKVSGREGHLQKQNIPQSIIDRAKNLDEEYSVWIAREIMKWIKSIEDYGKNLEYWKGQHKDSKNADLVFKNHHEVKKLSAQIDPVSGRELKFLNDDYQRYKDSEQGLHTLSVIMARDNEWNATLDWVRQTNADVMSMTYAEASLASHNWHEEMKNKEVDESIEYKTHNVVYQFEDGWQIVRLEAGDCEAEGEKMGHCVGGYGDWVADGRTQIYSLRDPKNGPHVTMEMKIPEAPEEEVYHPTNVKDRKTIKSPITIEQIQGKGNDEPKEEYKEYVKAWFDSLKQDGFEFEELEFEDGIDFTNVMEVYESQNDYGISYDLSDIGGSTAKDWMYDLELAFSHGDSRYGNHFDSGQVETEFDNLMDFAVATGRIEAFDGAVDSFSEWANEKYFVYSNEDYYENQYPNEDDEEFYTEPEPKYTEEGNEIPQDPVFNQEAYDSAMEAYEEEKDYYAQQDPYISSSSYLIKEWNKKMEKAKAEQPQEEVMASNETMVKTADKKIPSAEEIAAYVEALEIQLEKGIVKDEQLKKVIESLPYPDAIRMSYSEQECRVLFESVGWAWKKLSGQDLVEEAKIERAPKGLEGNYWMIKSGVLLEGPNHFTIIKQNLQLFSSLLGISTFVLHEKLASPPDELIKTVIDHGGMRIYVRKDSKGYFQLSDKTYSKWGRKKIKKIDIEDKIVKVIDRQTPYKGWKSGILVKL